ncbi:hypothetical protein B0H14DRAFT_3731695 [Mycena olivaceomarginata]|nr:hypothetical protein B0H14DRAFT_3731695 [Mycena olivaceomarginata]
MEKNSVSESETRTAAELGGAEVLQQLRLAECPVPKPSWTFPSPFIPYAVALESREAICRSPQPPLNPFQLAELHMYGLSWAIRSKPEWQRKITDPSIVEKWRTEALDQQEGKDNCDLRGINYVLAELAGYARLSDPITGIECGPFDAIWYSDRLISNDVSDRLRAAVAELENVPDDAKDWHPGSDDQVLDLVHPSLYCIVYGQTRCSDWTRPRPPPYEPPKIDDGWDNTPGADPVSGSFCWLPSDFCVDGTDGSVKLLLPYINNLHPTKHNPSEHGPGTTNTSEKRFRAFGAKAMWDGGRQQGQKMSSPNSEEASEVLPEALAEYTGDLEKTIAPHSLRGKTIHGQSEVRGRSWHVEAMLNERIVATAIYYYDEENISESRLAYRATTGAPTYHEQDGIVHRYIATSAGRVLAWPNLYQHRVAPFRLFDPTKPGHRKILAVFLVDPSIEPIPSATDIPPQQHYWTLDALVDARNDPNSLFSRLPLELLGLTQDYLAYTLMTRDEAEEHRQDLIEERTGFTRDRREELSYTFIMCEH